MEWLIRSEQEADYEETENITREAFWDIYKPGCDEHLIVHKLRRCEAFVKELDYVAINEGKIIGNIMYSNAKIVDSKARAYDVLCLGPVSVLPQYQQKGVGKALIKKTLDIATDLKYKGIFLTGDPFYYSRFGFRKAELFQVQMNDGTNADYFMGLELFKDSLLGIQGKFVASSVFDVEEAELKEFEKRFCYKEKHITSTQLK